MRRYANSTRELLVDSFPELAKKPGTTLGRLTSPSLRYQAIEQSFFEKKNLLDIGMFVRIDDSFLSPLLRRLDLIPCCLKIGSTSCLKFGHMG